MFVSFLEVEQESDCYFLWGEENGHITLILQPWLKETQALLAALFETIQAAATFGPTPVPHSTPVSQVSVALPIATGQVSSAFWALPAVGLIPQNLRELSSHLMPGSSCAEHRSLPKFLHGSAPVLSR